jgi:hypothetical protein
MSKNINVETTTSNTVKFIKASYNGIPIIMREEDKYVNVTQMVMKLKNVKKSNLKQYFEKNESFKKYFNKIYQSITGHISKPASELVYSNNELIKLSENYGNDYQGFYIHPKLINFITIWASPEYAYDVGVIMDAINEVTQYEGQTFEKVKDQILEAMKKKIEKLEKEGKKKEEEIIEQEIIIVEQKVKIHDESVRSEDNNKRLCIFKYEDGGYFISANQTLNKNKSSYWYLFPSTMHIRKLVVKQFKIKNFNIPKEKINEVNEYIISLKPKNFECNEENEE